MTFSRMALAVVLLAGFHGGSVQAQMRAPAGGAIGSNGQFYNGGQFMPSGSAGAGGGVSLFDFSDIGNPPPVPIELNAKKRAARLAARTAARTANRLAARGSSVDAADPIAVANSRIAMARSLIKAGNKKGAGEWLDKVIQMNASSETVKEASEIKAAIVPPAPVVELEKTVKPKPKD